MNLEKKYEIEKHERLISQRKEKCRAFYKAGIMSRVVKLPRSYILTKTEN